MVWALLARAVPTAAKAAPSVARLVGSTLTRASSLVVSNSKNIVSWLIPGYTIGSAVSAYKDDDGGSVSSGASVSGAPSLWPALIIVGALMYRKGVFNQVLTRRSRGLSL